MWLDRGKMVERFDVRQYRPFSNPEGSVRHTLGPAQASRSGHRELEARRYGTRTQRMPRYLFTVGLTTAVIWFAGGGTALAAPQAQLIQVTGGPLAGISVGSPGFDATMTPAFSPQTQDYALNCPSGVSSVTFTMAAASGDVEVNGMTGRTVTATVSLTTNQAAVVRVSRPTERTAHEYWIRCLPPNFPPLQVAIAAGHASNGYYLGDTTTIAPAQSTSSLASAPYVMVLDHNGTPVWWQQTPYPPAYFEMWERNVLIWDATPSGGAPNFVDANGYTTYNLRSGSTATLTPDNAPADGHAIIHLRDGNILFLTSPERTGVDLSTIGDGTNQNVADCGLQEVTPQGHVVWSWDALAHIGVDESIYPISEKTSSGQQFWDVFHCNSISLDPADRNQETADVLLSVREASGVYMISRATGDIVWKVGGVRPSAWDPDANAKYLSITGDPESGFYAQHDANLSTPGQLTLFDDHSGPPLYFDPSEVPGPARGVTYQINLRRDTAEYESAIVASDNQNSIATGSFRRYGSDAVVGWGISEPLAVGGTSANPFFSDVGAGGTVNLAVNFLEQPGATFPFLDASYRVVKVGPSQLSISLLRNNMGGLAGNAS